MKSFGSNFESFVRFLCCIEHAQTNNLTAELDVGIPCKASFIQVRPSEAGLASWSLGIKIVL